VLHAGPIVQIILVRVVSLLGISFSPVRYLKEFAILSLKYYGLSEKAISFISKNIMGCKIDTKRQQK
jgi:hypothetical protein